MSQDVLNAIKKKIAEHKQRKLKEKLVKEYEENYQQDYEQGDNLIQRFTTRLNYGKKIKL